jgi:hypothetical protein
MCQNSAPRIGDIFLNFNGVDNYVEVPSITDYSLSTTGALTVSAWIKPDVLNFPYWEGSGYVHWLGKGEGAGTGGQQEWVFRMYNRDHTEERLPRPNRVSFYLFNPEGGEGIGSYFQDALQEGTWIHVVGVADATRTHIFRDGQHRRCDTYRGDSDGECPIHFEPPPNENVQLEISPTAGLSNLRFGTRDFRSFFSGGITRVRLWSRALGADEISELFRTDVVPQDGLVAEFLLNADTGLRASDTAQGNDGTIFGATWAQQQ